MNTPLHWSISGILIGLIVPTLLLIYNKSFGISSVFIEVIKHKLFTKRTQNNQDKYWRFVFIGGIIVGAFIAAYFQDTIPINLDAHTVSILDSWGLRATDGLYPTQLFNFENPKAIVLICLGGFLVGFGSRMANGCTSGHCITGISNLQKSSLVISICFFIGAIFMSYFILPSLINYTLN